jgi:cysteine-rich repeat protein
VHRVGSLRAELLDETLRVAFVLLTALAAACGGGGDGGGGGGGPVGPTEACAVIGVDGGTLALEGRLTLEIPPEALGADLELCVRSQGTGGVPDADALASDVFLLEPEALFLAHPGALSIKLDRAAPAGVFPRLAQLSGGAWTTKAGPPGPDGWVTTDLLSLGTYAAVFVSTAAVEVPYDEEVALGLTWSFWDEGDPDGPLPLECTRDDQCTADAVCKSTRCVPPMTPGDFVPSGVHGYVGCVVPPADDTCCFDIDGDGDVDNRLMSIIAEWAGMAPGGNIDVSLSLGFMMGLEMDGTTYIADFRTLPDDGTGAVEFWLMAGDNDLDFDGVPDQTHAIKVDGQGLFQLDPKGFDGHGARSQFNRAAIQDGVLRAEGGDFWFGYTMPDGRVINVPAHGVRVEAPIEIGADAAAADEMRIGGYASFAEALAQWDETARACACAGIDPAEPVFAFDVTDGVFEAWCNQWPVDAVENCDLWNEYLCHSLPLLCLVAPVIGSQNDINSGWVGSDGTTGNDAMSFGLLLKVVPAALTDPVFMPDLVAVGDQMEVKTDTGPVRLFVLGNDTDVVHGTPTVTAVTTPEHGTATVSDAQDAVIYQPPAGFKGLDTFSYTMGGPQGTDSAAVTIYVGVEVAVAPIDDAFTVEINRGPHALDLLANDNFDPSKTAMMWLDLFNPSNLGDARLGKTADRRTALLYAPTTLDAGAEGGFEYSINYHPNFYRGGDAPVHLTFVLPEPICGDGIVDSWAEECDDGGAAAGDGCDAACALEPCDGGGLPTPWYADGDDDGFGDPADLVYACAAPPDRIPVAGDCDDTDTAIPGPESYTEGATCADGVDNDCDGWTDCAEYGCGEDSPACRELDCTDGLDSDGDGGTDCGDPDCEFEASCAEPSGCPAPIH